MAIWILKLGQQGPRKAPKGCIGVSDVQVVSFLFIIYLIIVAADVSCG
jgi:hypothetical protein